MTWPEAFVCASAFAAFVAVMWAVAWVMAKEGKS